MKQQRTPSKKQTATAGWNPLRKILVPTDFSGHTDKALQYAVDLARKYGAEIHLLHVIPPLEGDAYSPLRYTPEASVLHDRPDKMIYDLLASTAARQDAEDVRIELVKQRGMNVAATILSYAQQKGMGLIVMAIHGPSGVKRLLGSVSERVLHAAPCPVLSVAANRASGKQKAAAGSSLQEEAG